MCFLNALFNNLTFMFPGIIITAILKGTNMEGYHITKIENLYGKNGIIKKRFIT